MGEERRAFQQECLKRARRCVYHLNFNLIDSEVIDEAFEKEPAFATQNLREAIERFESFPSGLFSVTGHAVDEGRVHEIGRFGWFKYNFPEGNLEARVQFISQAIKDVVANYLFRERFPNDHIYRGR